jgi:hypothetical protein
MPAYDDADESTLLDAEVLAAAPPPSPATLAIITSESPGVALAATRSFELPALTIEPRDVEFREPSVILDAEIAAAMHTAAPSPPVAPPAPTPAVASPEPVAAPTPAASPSAVPASISARWMWPLDDEPVHTGGLTAGALADAHFAVAPRDLSPLLVGRMPGPPVAAHPTWATKRITAPRHFLVPVLVLAAMIATLYAVACAMF